MRKEFTITLFNRVCFEVVFTCRSYNALIGVEFTIYNNMIVYNFTLLKCSIEGCIWQSKRHISKRKAQEMLNAELYSTE